jgi:ATP-dependent exoDNAse (exonuclease V) alpha subunit
LANRQPPTLLLHIDELKLNQHRKRLLKQIEPLASGRGRIYNPATRSCRSRTSINHGVIPDLRKPEAEGDFYFVEADDPETAVARIIELVKTRIPRRFGLDPIRDVQVLCPMNRGGAGARSVNIELQAALNPAGDRKVERFGWTFAPGDKVKIENDYDKEVWRTLSLRKASSPPASTGARLPTALASSAP